MASCNGCTNVELKKKLGKRYLLLTVHGWPTVYEMGLAPLPGQDEPSSNNGQPIRFCAAFLELAHSYDEDCYTTREVRK